MESIKKNNQIHIDEEFLSTLSLAQGGFLGPIDKLMNQEEAEEVNQTGYYKGSPMPFSFIMAPNGKRNEQSIKDTKKGDLLELISKGKKVGYIIAESSHKISKTNRIKNIHGIYDESEPETQKILSNVGRYALSGTFKVDYKQPLEEKEKIDSAIKRLNAKKITGLMLGTKPLNRAHERLIRTSMEGCDLLVIFMMRPHKTDGLSYSLREKTLKFFIDTYLTNDKVLLVPLENTYMFSSRNNLILQCIVAANFGCTKFVVGRNHKGISIYYDCNQPQSSLDKYKKDLPLEIIIAPEYVFCNDCKTLVSTNTCPHGAHHHIKYHGKSLKELLLAGILPPALFIRRDISSIIMNELFPKRFKNIQALYDNLFPNDGLLVDHSEKDFYEELIRLHQTTSMV